MKKNITQMLLDLGGKILHPKSKQLAPPSKAARQNPQAGSAKPAPPIAAPKPKSPATSKVSPQKAKSPSNQTSDNSTANNKPTDQPPQTGQPGQLDLIPGLPASPVKPAVQRITQFQKMWKHIVRLLHGTSSQQQQLTAVTREVISFQMAQGAIREHLKMLDIRVTNQREDIERQIVETAEKFNYRASQIQTDLNTEKSRLTTVENQYQTIETRQKRQEFKQVNLEKDWEDMTKRWQNLRTEISPIAGEQRQHQERIRKLETASICHQAQIQALHDHKPEPFHHRLTKSRLVVVGSPLIIAVLVTITLTSWQNRVDAAQRLQVTTAGMDLHTMLRIQSLQRQILQLRNEQQRQQINLNSMTRQKTNDWPNNNPTENKSQNPNRQPLKHLMNTGVDVVVPGPNASYGP